MARYGVVAVRGAEVYELADEEGNLLNDPATQKERVSNRLRLLFLPRPVVQAGLMPSFFVVVRVRVFYLYPGIEMALRSDTRRRTGISFCILNVFSLLFSFFFRA